MAALKIVLYQHTDGSCPLLEWLDTISPTKARSKLLGRIVRLTELGHEIRRPHADYLDGGIYELRQRFGKTQYRMLFFFAGQDAAVITHGFRKPGSEVDEWELAKAKKYRDFYLKDPIKRSCLQEDWHD